MDLKELGVKSLIGIIIGLTLLIILMLIAYSAYKHHMYYMYSSGSWADKEGNILIIANSGITASSHIIIGSRNRDDTYDTLRSKCRIVINSLWPLPLYRFNMRAFIDDEPSLMMAVDIVEGTLELYKDGEYYATFSRT